MCYTLSLSASPHFDIESTCSQTRWTGLRYIVSAHARPQRRDVIAHPLRPSGNLERLRTDLVARDLGTLVFVVLLTFSSAASVS